MSPGGWTKWWTALIICPIYFGLLALCVMFAGDDDSIPAFKRRSADDIGFFNQVGLAVARAAHPTGAQPEVVGIELLDEPAQPLAKMLEMHLRYRGKLTGRRYHAVARLKLDSTDDQAWRASSVDYRDDNPIPPNRPALDALLRQLNR